MLRPAPRTLVTATLALGLGLAACAKPRTSAATQPTPAAFEPAKSDAKAVKLADEVMKSLGGDAAWARAQQISWDQHIKVDDKEIEFHHDWDRWNGRHRATMLLGDQEGVVVYEQFGDMAFAEIDGQPISSADTPKLVTTAKNRLALDSYMLLMPFKLKDPGVILKDGGELAEEADPNTPTLDVIKVSFEPGVGPSPQSVYYVNVRKSDKVITSIEMDETGKGEARIGYRLEDWTEVGGLKFARKRTNIGHPGEVWTFDNIKVEAEPNEDLFIKRVQ
jgi:hypothetical protein